MENWRVEKENDTQDRIAKLERQIVYLKDDLSFLEAILMKLDPEWGGLIPRRPV